MLLPMPDGVTAVEVLAALKYERATRGVRLVRVGAKWPFRTAEDFAWLLSASGSKTRKLSRVAMETLAIIVPHQPATAQSSKTSAASPESYDPLERDDEEPDSLDRDPFA